MSGDDKKIKERTFDFAIQIIALIKQLPKSSFSDLSRQVLRSGTSIGANIEEATGARTKRDFINCMNIAKKEARETKYWLRLLQASELINDNKLNHLLEENEIIIRILTSIVKTSESKPIP